MSRDSEWLSFAEYQCQWKACPRLKKNAPPFPSLHRLIRHVKEVHILKSVGRVVPPSDRSKWVYRRAGNERVVSRIPLVPGGIEKLMAVCITGTSYLAVVIRHPYRHLRQLRRHLRSLSMKIQPVWFIFYDIDCRFDAWSCLLSNVGSVVEFLA